MKCALVLTIVVLALACGDQPELLNEIVREPDTRRTLLTVEQLPPMPEFPEARRGRLVTQSAGEYDVHGSWKASAGLCQDVGVLEIYAGHPGLGNAIVLHMTDGNPLGTYPLVAAQADFPDSLAALVAVQVYQDPDAFGFQAYMGELELTTFGETVSGRFTSTLREIDINMVLHYVGVFEAIPVKPFAMNYCQTLRDSTLPPDSGGVSDSAAGEG